MNIISILMIVSVIMGSTPPKWITLTWICITMVYYNLYRNENEIE